MVSRVARRLGTAALAAAAPVLMAQDKPRLVPDVSQRQVDIRYSFTGAELLLFGAIIYPGARTPSTRADIVVVLKGPTQAVVVREKQKVAGIWMNADSARFRSAPGFYAIAASRPIEQLVDQRTAAIYELGLDNLQLSPTGGKAPDVQRRFEAGLVQLNLQNSLYGEATGSVEITDDVLYRARLRIPARVPVGTFTAETFLILDGKVVAAAVRPIEIRKSGFERFIAYAADQWSFTYGIVAVALSLAFGWGAGMLFRRG